MQGEQADKYARLRAGLEGFPAIFFGELYPRHDDYGLWGHILNTHEYLGGNDRRVQEQPGQMSQVVAEMEGVLNYVNSCAYRHSWHAMKAYFYQDMSVYALLWLQSVRPPNNRPIVAKVSQGKKTALHYYWNIKIDTPEMKVNFSEDLTGSAYKRKGSIILSAAEARAYGYRVEGSGLDGQPASMEFFLTPRKYDELSEVVQGLFATQIADVALRRRHHNCVYDLHLRNGERMILKEFPQDGLNRAERDARFLLALEKEGVVPASVLIGNKLFLRHIGERTLLDLGENNSLYKKAIDIIVAIEELQRSHPEFLEHTPVIGEDYFRKKFGIVPRHNPQRVVISSPTLYQGHYIMNSQGGLCRIDFENSVLAPAELSLVNLFLGSPRPLSQGTMDELIAYYIESARQRGTKLDDRIFMESFEQLYLGLLAGSRGALDHAQQVNKR